MKFQKTVSSMLVVLFVITAVHITKNMVSNSGHVDNRLHGESHNPYHRKLRAKAPDLFILINNAKKNSLKSGLSTAILQPKSVGGRHIHLRGVLGLGGDESASRLLHNNSHYSGDINWLQNDAPAGMAQAPQTDSVVDTVVRDILLLPIGTPVNGGTMSSGYGMRKSPFTGLPAAHLAMDIAADIGTAVKTTAPGVVVATGDSTSLGLFVVVKHSGGIMTRYCHLSSVAVEHGDSIKRGTVIGSVGSTGRSTGPHLHYEIRIAGRRVNPIYFVRLAKEIEDILQQDA